MRSFRLGLQESAAGLPVYEITVRDWRLAKVLCALQAGRMAMQREMLVLRLP
jgi:hypothetical protein